MIVVRIRKAGPCFYYSVCAAPWAILEGLAPGLIYQLGVAKGYYGLQTSGPSLKGLTIKSGETKDLGEIQVKPMP